jgi:hypothetical protein
MERYVWGITCVSCVAFLSLSLLPTEASAVTALSPAQIKKDMGGKDVIKFDVRPGGGAVKNAEGVIYWEQTVEIHYKTEWKGITYVLRGDVEYNWAGNKWVFVRFRKNNHWYLGVDPPSEADIKKAIESSNAGDLFDTYLQKQATQVFLVKLAKDPKFSFSSPNEVSFELYVEFEVVGYQELKRVHQTGTVGLKRSLPKDKWSSACRPDNPCLLGGIGSGGQRHEISKRKLSDEQIKKIPTLYQIGLEKWVTPKYAALGAPEKFKDETEFARFAYKALYTGDLKTWDAFLIRNWGDREPEAYNKGRDWFINQAEAFRRQYCPELVLAEPPVKIAARGVRLKFMDKAKGNKGFLQVDWRQDGFWVNDLAVDLAEGAKADEIAAVPADKGCVEDLPPPPNLNPQGFKVGEKVVASVPNWSKDFLGEILEVHEDGRARVHLSDNSNVTMAMTGLRRATPEDEERLQNPKGKRPAVKPPEPAKPAAELPAGLAVGDRVMSKWQGTGKELPGKVKQLKPGKVMVWYDDGSKEWVPAEAVRKVDK